MLRILGSSNPFGHLCGRRDAMQIGALAGGSLALPELLFHESLGAAESATDATFGRAKNILLLYLQGAASHFETWDPKPDAPEGIRGKWSAIPTVVPGTFIGEKLPKLSRLTDRMAIVRSMTHDHNNHSNLYTLSGAPAVDFSSETNPFDTRHRPFFGSVLDYLADRESAGDPPELPRNIGLPWQFSNFAPFSKRAGPYGSFLGHGYSPVWTEFEGTATNNVKRVSFFNQLKDVEVADPFLGITPESRLRISRDAQLREGMTIDRLDRRRSLLGQLDEQRRHLSEEMAGRSLDRFTGMAYTLMTSDKLRNALDVGQEPVARREQYGMNLFGQSVLTALRLLESGCRLVSVFWDEYKVVNTAWDTHFNHFNRLEKELLPGFDSAVSSLLTDMDERGMLHETLVLCLTEHGRTPKINNFDRGAGRDHWSKAYSVMLAGAGIRRGTVVGASDTTGAFVANRPVSPEDILATMYHLKGIAPETTIPDRGNRPTRLVDHGAVIEELLA